MHISDIVGDAVAVVIFAAVVLLAVAVAEKAGYLPAVVTL